MTFESVFVAEYNAMVALAAAISNRRDLAEDIAQDAMARMDANWDTVQHYDKPGAWLRRVTINLAISRKRRLRAEALAVLKLSATPPRLETNVEEIDRTVWGQVAKLPPMQRAAVCLHFLEDLPATEIGEILEIEPATVRVHLHRGKQRLRKALQASETEREEA